MTDAPTRAGVMIFLEYIVRDDVIWSALTPAQTLGARPCRYLPDYVIQAGERGQV